MTAGDPTDADVLLVGANAATPFPEDLVDRDDYIETLLEGGPKLRGRYERVRSDRGPSPTRRNIDRTTQILLASGARGVMETNVWAIPTSRLSELRQVDPTLRRTSETVLPQLITITRPRAIVVHGAAATRGTSRCVGTHVAIASGAPCLTQAAVPIWSIPSLSPPAANT